MSFPLVPKSVTLNDLGRPNGPYFWVISLNSCTICRCKTIIRPTLV